MCVIVVKPKGVIFSDQDFKKCWDRNSHGLGFIVTDPFKCVKGLMMEKKALKATKEFRKADCEAVFHFRISSKGAVCSNLTHPFPFHYKDGRERYLFHNGTIHTLRPDSSASDTSLASDWLSVLDDSDCDKLLKHWDSFGRFVTVIQDSSGKRSITIYEDKESTFKDGLWYSNLRHLDPKDRPLTGDGMYHY